ncbi:MAG TPA: hemerythrin domain-containing protein [Caulobacteraceae bacterium]|nr:hemerythrin domain-containing protein [Caulobacteraceae bacterium]
MSEPRRHDLYGPIHKGIRRALSGLLLRLGSTDFADDRARVAVLADLRTQLRLSAGHLHHEEAHIHARLEARSPGAAARLEHAHREHDEAFAELEAIMGELETAPAALKPALGRSLYLRFSRFAADDFAHMADEETVTLPLLWSLFSDEEVRQMEADIVGSIAPEDNIAYLRLMIPAMNPQERFAFLDFVRAAAPKKAFEAILEHAARPTLDGEDWNALAMRLRLAA